LMSILFLCCYTMWLWVMLHKFQWYMLPPSLGWWNAVCLWVRVHECIYIYIYTHTHTKQSVVLKMNGGRGNKMGIGALASPGGTLDRESCADSPFKGPGMYQNSH
jgi:hypothetical protein